MKKIINYNNICVETTYWTGLVLKHLLLLEKSKTSISLFSRAKRQDNMVTFIEEYPLYACNKFIISMYSTTVKLLERLYSVLFCLAFVGINP